MPSHLVATSKPVIRTRTYWLGERLGQPQKCSHSFCSKVFPEGCLSFQQRDYDLKKCEYPRKTYDFKIMVMNCCYYQKKQKWPEWLWKSNHIVNVRKTYLATKWIPTSVRYFCGESHHSLWNCPCIFISHPYITKLLKDSSVLILIYTSICLFLHYAQCQMHFEENVYITENIIRWWG